VQFRNKFLHTRVFGWVVVLRVFGAHGAVRLVLSSWGVVRVNDQLKQGVWIAWALFGNQLLPLVEGLYVE